MQDCICPLAPTSFLLDLNLIFQEAIKAGSFYSYPNIINCGDVDKAFQQADHVIEGEVHVGGQEHFYLETMSTLAVPKGEDGEMELYVSTQNPTLTQVNIQ